MLSFALFLLGAIYVFALMQPFINRLRDMRVGPQLPRPARPQQGQSSDPTIDAPEDHGFYEPTPIDIAVTRILMTRGLKFPPHLVDAIFDFAEYWAHSSNERDYLKERKAALRICGRSAKEDHLLLRSFPVGLTGLDDREDAADVLQYETHETKPRPIRHEHDPAFFSKLARYPTPRLAHPVRKIVFTTRSRDQGMGLNRSADTYDEGWTWFEAGLERFDADQTCDAYCKSDLRYKSPTSVPFDLPICALRPIFPTFSKRPKSDEESEEKHDQKLEQRPDRSPDASDDAKAKTKEPEYAYDHGYMPDENRVIQRNLTRKRAIKTHVVEWTWTDDINPESDGGMELKAKGRGRGTGDGRFVRDLKLGDVITIWGKAKFPAWENNIEKVRIDVYWAV